MPTYVVLLRAINLGALRRFGKDDVARVTEAAGFTDVATWLNTGNVRVSTRRRSAASVEEALEAAYRADRGFEVPCVALTPDDLAGVVADGEALLAGQAVGWEGRDYVSVLKHEPEPDGVRDLAARTAGRVADGEAVVVRGRAVHLLLGSYGTAKVGNDTVERSLGTATNRGLDVLRTLRERWG